MLNKIRQAREQRAQETGHDGGFTLIELLVVVVIIGILIAIAIPLYLNYQKGAKNKSAASDTRNGVAVVEQCYADNNNTYPDTEPQSAAGGSVVLTCADGDQTINVSPGNKLTYTSDPVAGTYTIATKAGSPGDKTYTYASATGKTS